MNGEPQLFANKKEAQFFLLGAGLVLLGIPLFMILAVVGVNIGSPLPILFAFPVSFVGFSLQLRPLRRLTRYYLQTVPPGSIRWFAKVLARARAQQSLYSREGYREALRLARSNDDTSDDRR
jgi:hypothetical protein